MGSVLSEVDDVAHTTVALAREGIYYGEKKARETIFYVFLFYFEEERPQIDVKVAKRKRGGRDWRKEKKQGPSANVLKRSRPVAVRSRVNLIKQASTLLRNQPTVYVHV